VLDCARIELAFARVRSLLLVSRLLCPPGARVWRSRRASQRRCCNAPSVARQAAP
jgi:hypothetical protein